MSPQRVKICRLDYTDLQAISYLETTQVTHVFWWINKIMESYNKILEIITTLSFLIKPIFHFHIRGTAIIKIYYLSIHIEHM